MPMEPPPRRILLVHAAPDAIGKVTRRILASLGYAMMTPEEFAESDACASGALPALRIVDERSLAELPEDGSPIVPIVALTGRHGVTGADSRIVGAIRRPAGLHELYRLVQELLEDIPRSTPRIPTHLPARCSHDGKEWLGAVLSLSENGCLLRSSEPRLLGSNMTLVIDLSRTGKLQLLAEVTYQLLPDLGLTFHATSPSDREAISDFIERTLVA
jgi:hypothetical protein